MKSEIKNLSKTKIEIYFQFPWGEFEQYYNKAVEKINAGIALDGFRPGKAPKEIIEQKFPLEKILDDAAELALQKEYYKIVKDKNLEVIGQPNVEILKLAKGNDFEAKIKAEILPEVVLPDYKKIAGETEKEKITVEEKEVEEALDWVKKSRAIFEDIDREAKKEDMVEIIYSSKELENGKEFEDRFFLGKGQLIPGFEEQIEGMNKGEEKEFEAVFPKDYFNKELAGKPVKFNLKLKNVQKAIFPEIDDEFAKSLGEFKNLEALKKSIGENIEKEKEEGLKQKRRDAILEKIISKSEFELPEILLTQEKERIVHQLEHDVKDQLNISLDEYIKHNFKDEKEFDDKMNKQAEARIKSFLVIKAIGEKEKIEAPDAEVEMACNQFLSKYQDAKSVENQIDPERLKSYYRSVIYNEKVLEKLENF